jgi:hypothetical protein
MLARRRRLPVHRRPIRRVGPLMFLIVAISVASVVPAANAALPTKKHRIANWAPVHETGGSFSKTQAISHARRFDIISARVGTYRGYVGAMKAANPNLVLLVYLNGTFAQRSQGTLYPESWYLRDRYGAKVRSRNYGNYLMDPGNAGWIKNRIDTCRRYVNDSGYDGCWIDMLGTGPLMPGYCTGLPINPRTNAVWTEPAWLQHTGSLAAKIKHGVGRIVVGNGLGSGLRYFNGSAPTESIMQGIDGGVAETWIRTAYQSASAFPNESKWRMSVDMLADTGKHTFVVTKLWSAASLEQRERWRRFSLATFLLGTQGRSWYYFSGYEAQSAVATDPLLELRLGKPSSNYRKANGVYERTFAKGKVIVNPSPSTFRVPLGQRYWTASGTAVRSVTLGPYGSAILTS